MLVIVDFSSLTWALFFCVVALSHMMHRQAVYGVVLNLLVNSFPDSFHTLFVVQTFEDTITSNHEEVEVGLKFEYSDFGIAHDNVRVATIPDALCLDITEGS